MLSRKFAAASALVILIAIDCTFAFSQPPASAPPLQSTTLYPSQPTAFRLLQLSSGPAPIRAPGGPLRLINGSPDQRNVALFQHDFPASKSVEIHVRFRMNKGAHGWGLALLRADQAERQCAGIKTWEEPSPADCFAIGVDTYDPPTKNWFNAECNIYGRPQREISLHWAGREQAKRLCPVEFRDRRPHLLRFLIDYQIGGAAVSLWLDDQPVYERLFIAEMTPYRFALAIGGRTAAKAIKPRATMELLGAQVRCGPPAPAFPGPVYRCRIFDGEILNQKRQKAERVVQLPPAGQTFARIILTLTLSKPPQGIDPWDRGGSIRVFDGDEAYEIQRFITPFGRGYTWKSDVTDYLPLLTGQRKFSVSISTWVGQKGWKVTADLDYYPGRPHPQPFKVQKLWSGFFEYGNPNKPLRSMLPPRLVAVPPQATAAKLRVVVTGHGMHPATNNAGEFFPAWRTVVVNSRRFKDLLWRQDCYLNPCRPQGGTWKFDRAGWCPGSLVRPWDIDISKLIQPGGKLRVEYIPQPYVNKNRAKAKAWHDIEVQLIYYR